MLHAQSRLVWPSAAAWVCTIPEPFVLGRGDAGWLAGRRVRTQTSPAELRLLAGQRAEAGSQPARGCWQFRNPPMPGRMMHDAGRRMCTRQGLAWGLA